MGLKTKTFVFIVISFLLGGVAGGFIGKSYFANQGGRNRPTRAATQKQFADRLKLNAAQSARVDSILESFRQSYSQVQSGYWKTRRDSVRMSIRSLLSPDQNKLFDDFIKEMDERDAKRRENPDH